MLEEQLKELALIVKNDDLRKYAGNAFWNLIQAVISKDPVSGTLAGKDVKQIVFHMPTVIFWNKIKRFLQGTYKDYEEQVKMASQFNNDNEKYAEFVKKQIGVSCVSEPCALLASNGDGKFLEQKYVQSGITISIYEEKFGDE